VARGAAESAMRFVYRDSVEEEKKAAKAFVERAYAPSLAARVERAVMLQVRVL